MLSTEFKDLSELFEEEEMDIYRRFDEVEADTLTLFFRRGSDEKTIQYNVTLPYDCNYGKFAEYFAKFLSEVYEYDIKIKAYTEPYKKQQTCEDCTNVGCLAKQGC